MIDYRVRSVSLLNLVNDIRNGRLIPDAYFQRNLVWRDVHKIDFIKTIRMGLPFPQIFISKGKVDVDAVVKIMNSKEPLFFKSCENDNLTIVLYKYSLEYIASLV